MLKALITFFTKYKAQLSSYELPFNGKTNKLNKIGYWNQFLWDIQIDTKYLKKQNLKNKKFSPKKTNFILGGVARSKTGHEVIKIQILKSKRKKNSLLHEYKLLKYLESHNCITSCRPIKYGRLPIYNLKKFLPSIWIQRLRKNKIKKFSFLITEYLSTSKKAPLADIILAILEQKGLGVFHGDIKPSNLRYNESTGICHFIDYDQASFLKSSEKKLNTQMFFEWCNDYDKKNFLNENGKWFRNLQFFNERIHLHSLLKNGSFNLNTTTPHKRQNTTNSTSGIYQTLNNPIVFTEGSRSTSARLNLLNNIKFEKGERVLDVGCNLGLLTHYFAKKGCRTTGVDLDPHIITSAKILANILGINAKFLVMDLDTINCLEHFDTICLFSVIHHTKNLNKNGNKIAKACRRIIIECRLSESGKKPLIDAQNKVSWIETSIWRYQNDEALFTGLSNVFPGFFVKQKLGRTDKNRYVLEMEKI